MTSWLSINSRCSTRIILFFKPAKTCDNMSISCPFPLWCSVHEWNSKGSFKLQPWLGLHFSYLIQALFLQATEVIFCMLLCGIHLAYMQIWYRGMCCTLKKTFPKLLCHCCPWWIRFSEAQYQVIKQTRRAFKATFADIAVPPLNNTSTTQEEVIGNGHNKTSLVTLVSQELNAVEIMTNQAEDDADNLSISTALE